MQDELNFPQSAVASVRSRTWDAVALAVDEAEKRGMDYVSTDLLRILLARTRPAEGMVLRNKNQYDSAIRICNIMTDEVGEDEGHPLSRMMLDLMDAIGAWEDADPELQAFFSEGAASTEGDAP